MDVVLGIEYTDERVTAVEMVAKGGRFSVRKILSEPLREVSPAETPPQMDAEQKEPYELFKKFHHHRSVLALPVKNGLMREITVPFTKDEHIRRTIKYEAERLIPTGKIEEYIIDFYRLGEEDGRSRVFIVGMRADTVETQITFLREAGFDPIKVDVDIAAAYGALKAAGFELETEKEGDESEERVEVLAAFHLGQVMVWVHLNGELRRTRSFMLHSKDAEKLVEKFERELRRTLIASGISTQVQRLSVAGDITNELKELLRKKLDADVETLSLKEAFGEPLDEEQKTQLEVYGLVACGAALKLLGHDPFAIDLRQGELAYRRPFDVIKTALSCTLTLLFFLSFLIAYTHQLKYARDNSQLSLIRRKAAEYLDVLLPNPDKRRQPNRPVSAAYEEFVKLLRERQSGERGKTATVSALDVLLEIGKARMKIEGRFLLRSCSIQPRKIAVEVEVDRVETGDALRNYIDKNSRMLITEAAPYRLERKRSAGGGVEAEKIVFNYTFRVRTEYER